MTSPDIITAHATPAGYSVMRFASRSRQPQFAYANDGASPARYNRVRAERN